MKGYTKLLGHLCCGALLCAVAGMAGGCSESSPGRADGVGMDTGLTSDWGSGTPSDTEDSSSGSDVWVNYDVPVGLCGDAPNGSPCNDEDPCTVGDTCSNGVCVGGANKVCDEEGPCRTGTCSWPDGSCSYVDVEDGTQCSMACFSQASCEAGECKAVEGTHIQCPSPDDPCVDELKCNQSTGECTVEIYSLEGASCDSDDNVCSIEQCDAAGGCLFVEDDDCAEESAANPCWTYMCNYKTGCKPSIFVQGADCEDNNPCTWKDRCTTDEYNQKICLGEPLPTDDLNPCTDDKCVDGEVLHTKLNGVVCPIESPCSEAGICDDGTCLPATPCECQVDADCGESPDLCAGDLFCDWSGVAPKCAFDPDTTINCPDPQEACQVATCDPATGLCGTEDENDGIQCDDESLCTAGDVCLAGVCTGSAVDCSDGVFCNGEEPCAADSGCGVATPVDPDDGIDCTIDVCDPDGADAVENTPDDALCDDLNPCNGVETCDAQLGCVVESVPVIDDGFDCTVDSCDPATGEVTHTPDDSLCDDLQFCNGVETCDALAGCVSGTAPDLSDGVDCTIDACDEDNDVATHTPDDSACDDLDVCTGVETCDAVLGCQAGTPIDYSDGVGCTIDSCDPVAGPQHEASDAACSDGQFCNGDEWCDAVNDCQGGPLPPKSDNIDCTVDTCDEANDVIVHTPDDTRCPDPNLCDGIQYCDPAVGCVEGPADPVDDGIACTTDGCDPATGVLHMPVDAACDDLDECNGVETCDIATGCQPGTPKCPDDGLFCNGPELCDAGGNCFQGAEPPLSDGVFCTNDWCDEGNDVVQHDPVDGLCPAGQTCDPVLDCVGGSCSYLPAGSYALSPGVNYSCAFGLVTLNYWQFNFNDTGVWLNVSPLMNGGCQMTGDSAVCGHIDVECTYYGTCDETYRLVADYVDADTWQGTLTANYVGMCFGCAYQSWSITGTRQ